jgi:enoyl-CoA hydratase/carnithine racemase
MTLRLEIDGPIAHLLIDRPERHNAFTLAMWQALPGLLAETVANPDVRVIVLTSARAGLFCAGADIGEMFAARQDGALRTATQDAINAAQYALARAAKPTIAFIDGDAIGGGCGLALACDMRVATARARLGITPARLGLIYPLHDTALLVDLVGPGQARRLMFSGLLIGADEAYRIGLIEDIADSAMPLATMIAANSAFSIAGIKRMVARVLDGQKVEDAASLALFASAFTEGDFGQRAEVFLARRKA